MTDTGPAVRSAAASVCARARQAALGPQPLIRATIAAASPRDSAWSTDVIADCSAPETLNARASNALTTRNTTTPAAIRINR
jgi:hypothetical protein